MHKFNFFPFFIAMILLFSCVVPCAAAESEDVILPGAPDIRCSAALLIDLDSDTVLYSQNADERVYPASLTKVMTALLILKYGSLSDTVTVSAQATDIPSDASSVGLLAGEDLSMENLLYCILVSSANEACNAAAEHISGSISAFVELMNTEAALLGCTGTHFTNTNGLHDEEHYTTARDLARITVAALAYPKFVTICNTASKEIPATNLSGPRYLKTTNYLISSNTVSDYVYSKACGVKTGHTSQSGYCLISTAESGGTNLLCVMMGAKGVELSDGTTRIESFTQTKELFEYGFSSFDEVTLLRPTEMIADIPVIYSSETDSVVLCPAETLSAVLPSDYDIELLEKEVLLSEESPVEAPVSAGEIFGSVTVRYDGRELGTVALTAIADIERSDLLFYAAVAKDLLSGRPFRVMVAILAAVILTILLLHAVRDVRRRKQDRSRRTKRSRAKR